MSVLDEIKRRAGKSTTSTKTKDDNKSDRTTSDILKEIKNRANGIKTSGNKDSTSDTTLDKDNYSRWESVNKDSMNELNYYLTKANKNEWMTEDDFTSYRKALDDYIESTNKLRGFNGSYSDADEKKWLDSISSMNQGYDEITKFYSQFAHEDAYNSWYESYKNDTEYEKHSNYNAEEATQGWQKFLSDTELAQAEAKDEKWWETLGRWMGGSGGLVDTTLPMATTTQTINALRADDSYRRPRDDWSEDQRNAFGALYLTSPDLAFNYAEETNKRIDKKKEEDAIAAIQTNATSGFWSGLGNTLGALATAPLGMADYLNDIAMANAGRDIVSDGNISPFEYSQAVTSGISTHLNENGGVLNEDIPIFGGKGWGDVYGLGTSIAQSMISAYTLGAAGTLVSYFGQGAASGMDDALSRGASEGQAALYGAAVGLFEGVAEQIGIDNLFKIGASSTFKGFIKNILKQAGAEGAEEGLTALFTNIADNVILQDKSNFNAMVAEFMKTGLSEEEAKRKAWWSSFEDVAFDTIAGAASGSVSGLIQAGGTTVASNIKAKRTYGDGSSLVSEARKYAEDNSELKALAEEYSKKLDGGKQLSGSQINKLNNAMVDSDVSKIKAAVESRLTKLGEKGDVTQIADAISKLASGEEITSAEKALIKESKFGRRVVNELSPRNIESGMYTSAWAENIGTRRINPLSYNKDIKTAALMRLFLFVCAEFARPKILYIFYFSKDNIYIKSPFSEEYNAHPFR